MITFARENKDKNLSTLGHNGALRHELDRPLR